MTYSSLRYPRTSAFLRSFGIDPGVVAEDGLHEDYIEVFVRDARGDRLVIENEIVTAYMPWPVSVPEASRRNIIETLRDERFLQPGPAQAF